MLDRYSVSLMKYLQYEYKPNIRDNRIMIIASISEKIEIMLLLQVICRYSIDIPYQHFFQNMQCTDLLLPHSPLIVKEINVGFNGLHIINIYLNH